jgi:hypothetical protein
VAELLVTMHPSEHSIGQAMQWSTWPIVQDDDAECVNDHVPSASCSSAIAVFMSSAGRFSNAWNTKQSNYASKKPLSRPILVQHNKLHPTTSVHLAWAYLARRRSLFFVLGASTMVCVLVRL